MRILLWHVHGAWTTAFVHGRHEYVVPVLPDRGPDGVGLARTYAWPDSVTEVPPEQLRDDEFDVVLLQRPHELEGLAQEWLGRRPGRDVPAVYVEHNAPQGRITDMRHPAADRPDLLVVHVTHFNALFWDTGSTRTRVIEHGIVDPGHRYTGELPRAAVVINEARRRARVTGTDLLDRFSQAAPIDLFGMDAASLGGIEDLPQQRPARRDGASTRLPASDPLDLARSVAAGGDASRHAGRRAGHYRGARGGAARGGSGVDADRLPDRRGAAADRRPRGGGRARHAARAAALERYGLERFLADWDDVLEEVA